VPVTIRAVRLLLGALGLAQVGLGVLHIVRNASVTTPAAAGPGHLWHEAAAWNAAIGVGFLWIALRRTRPGDALPILTTFVALWVVLSAWDLSTHRIDHVELLGHGSLLAGYLVVLVLRHLRPPPDTGGPPAPAPVQRPALRLLRSPDRTR
jgi:predicted anti-sigma-YlaC factor YlaD